MFSLESPHRGKQAVSVRATEVLLYRFVVAMYHAVVCDSFILRMLKLKMKLQNIPYAEGNYI